MKEVLVLNKFWNPIGVNSLFEAVCKVLNERAYIVDDNYISYDWEKWIKEWSDVCKTYDNMFYTGSLYVCRPKIIVLKNYKGHHNRTVKLNRKNVFARDNYTCQYCGYHGRYKTLNIDHIVPVSQGGRTKWKNVVVSCIPCNQKKGGKTPAEANMRLKRNPFKPSWTELHKEVIRKNYHHWKELLGDLYWLIELTD